MATSSARVDQGTQRAQSHPVAAVALSPVILLVYLLVKVTYSGLPVSGQEE